ncbi:hypothetical protein RHSIM_Rhsim10G0033500 [Rhododendron simsii]|uniref:CCHC-type domain-containing protein n=1 Tax=Rhododendron simsii TaxID=118357 RepID=A0A834GCE8_RHOSS|nr:hypothetical protein RHSIM_Rhsim10G0033500 [Rhododendron simsii]
MAPRKQRTMEEIYEADNARMQQQIAALTEQIAALTVAFQQQPLNSHFTEEEDERSAAEDEENPFARDLARRKDRPHQKALQAEKQAKRQLGNYGGASGSNRNTTQSGINRGTVQVGNPPMVPQNRNPIATGGPRCFKCGEPGHRIADCKKAGPYGKGLFIESEEIVGDEFDVSQQDPIFDSANEQVVYEEHVTGDDGPLLVPRAPVDLAPVPDLKRVHGKATELIAHLQDVHTTTQQNLLEATAKYKCAADKKRRLLEFAVGDFVWAVLTKDRFSAGEYNKLAARKIGPLEVVEKINSNAYRLQLPSHIRTSNVFNVKHLFPYHGDNSDDEPANSRSNSFQPREDDADHIAEEYMKKGPNSGPSEGSL